MNAELPRTAMPGQPPAQLAHIRLSDRERDTAISALADAYAEGRLDVEEFEARMGAASRARVVADLGPLFEDLPQSRGRIEARQGPLPSARPSAPAARCAAAGRTRPHPPWGLMPLLFLAVLLITAHMWIVIPLMIMFTNRAHHRHGLRSARSGRLAQRGW